jgi:hypothetical protein
MEIYIPGIKLPKDEPGAFRVVVMYVGADGKLRAECEGTHEVILVPEHNRLIDARKLHDKCYQHYEDYMNGKSDGKKAILNIEKEIMDAPTIIPASKEGE